MQTYIIATAYFLVIIELLIISRSFQYARRERRADRPTYTPKVAIIAPHYGWDADIAEHAKGLLHQVTRVRMRYSSSHTKKPTQDTMSLTHTYVKLLKHIRMSTCC